MPEEPEGYVNYVQRVYESRSNDELASNYDAWADTYDQDTIENWGRLDPDVGAQVFARQVSYTTLVIAFWVLCRSV